MSSITNSGSTYSATTEPNAEWPLLLALASAVALLHILTNGRYGFHRDELQFLSDARHLDWGFVSYPPLTPFLEHIGLALFGVSLVGLRLFSVILSGRGIVVTGLMAKELGGSRLAQCHGRSRSSVLARCRSSMATEFQYTSFDFFWWVLIAYFVIRLLTVEDPRWWLAIGATVGIGLLTKYSIVFYIAGILAGVVLTPARRYLLSIWFWAGIALALLIFLPNFLWLVRHDFISYHFLQHIHARDVSIGRADGFLLDQFRICINFATFPLWLAGLVAFLRCRRYRMVAFMYLVPLALFFFGKGRGYYMAAAYPMLLAMGATRVERWLTLLPTLGPPHRTQPSSSPLRHWSAPTSSPSSFRSHPAARSATSPSSTTATCAKNLAGTSWSAPSRRFAIHSRPTSRRTSASQQATTASTEPSKSSALPTAFRSPSAPPTPNICAAIRRLSPPPSSSLEMILRQPTHSSPAAASPDTTATPKASRTKRANTTLTSSSAAHRACPGRSSGKTTRTSVEVAINTAAPPRGTP